MARSRGSFQARAPRRRRGWDVGPGGTTITTFTTSSSAFLGSAITPNIDGLTLARLRGELAIHLQSTSAAGDGFTGAFGIGLATFAAVTAGIASVPTPITEMAWDGWIYHTFFSIRSAGIIAAGTAADDQVAPSVISSSLRREVDSKAMRKLNDLDAIYACVEVVETGTVVMNVDFNSRSLLLLP